ncbi:hypothetical protein Rhopal_002409-T1 [Rhodotorula paludigena]|uniref:Cytosine-purine permease n=1 Tax=Rhodotorula paludigena TaxID=86838 RepID=A0AAV5GHQ5_9BASI|nr:hypothetical protein Rhopal_002409-T1 [Rhodotorula paludigena]
MSHPAFLATAGRSPSSELAASDEEKAATLPKEEGESSSAPSLVVARDEIVSENKGPFVRLSKYLKTVGVETRSLERVPEDQREQMFFWFSVNFSFSCCATGFLGSLYYTLDYHTSLAVIYCGVALGCCVSATMATIGPKTGLRTMAAARFAGGWPGTAFMSLLNAICQICYGVSTAIAGAQALRAIHGCSLAVGIVVLTLVVYLLALWGFKLVHYWERWAWIGCLIIYFIVFGLGSKGDYDVHRLTESMDTGKALRGDVLSFFGIMFSVGSGWTSIAADYNMSLPVDTPAWLTWGSSFIGMYIPITFTCTLSATFLALSKSDYVQAFEEGSLGGVVGHILTTNVSGATANFGRFLLVLLAFSTVSANVPNLYSGALCVQSIHPWLMRIPRVFFVTLCAIIILVCALVGREHLSEIVGNFSAILAYYTAFLASIVFIEIFWFRRKNGPLGRETNWDDVTDYSKLPVGVACVASIACTIGVVVPSMAATWYVGPIAKAVTMPDSEYGGDLGFEVSAGVSIITYTLFRYAEIWYFKR